MKISFNIYDKVNLIFNTYTFLFFESAADNLYVVGQLLPCKTSQQDSMDGGGNGNGRIRNLLRPKYVKP